MAHLKYSFSASLATAAFLAVCSPGLCAEDVDAEFQFAARLVEEGFPEYAVYLAERLVGQYPGKLARAEVIRAQALISQRKFEPAAKILDNMPPDSPKTQAIKLALADGYYQVGRLEDCTAIYTAFFDAWGTELPEDPDLRRFLRSSAHKFAQMLARKGEIARAASVYDLVVESITDVAMRRQVLVEQAELLARAAAEADPKTAAAMLKKADANCSEVLWGGMDLWFGRALTGLARIYAVRGDREDARALLSANLEMLRTLDDLLEEAGIPTSESPFAAARSLLGSLYKEEGDLLLAARETREEQALGHLEAALAELKGVWALILRTARRDAVIVERNDNDTSILAGSRAERVKPFDDIAAALAELDKAGREGNPAGWADATRARGNTLVKAASALLDEVKAAPKKTGVTARREMDLELHAEWRRSIEKALALLATEGVRGKSAVEHYVKSLQQYYSVFAGYPGSSWATEAGEVVEPLKDRLRELTGKDVRIQAREDSGLEKLARVKLREGRKLLSSQEYAKAADTFRAGLEQYPEGAESLVALSDLMACYAALNDDVRVRMVANYVAERFNSNPAASQALLRQGRAYFEKKNAGMYKAVYEIYLRYFPEHHAAPTILYTLGEQHWLDKDYDRAVPYYKRIVDGYATSTYFMKALNRIGWSLYLQKDYEAAREVFARLVKDGRPGMEQARGKLCLADTSRLLEDHVEALTHYRGLAKWLATDNSAYTREAARIGANAELRQMLEQAVFFQAYSLSQITEPEDKVPQYRAAAAKMYRTLIDRFPSSNLLPTAFSSLGVVLLLDDKAKEAADVYDELAQRFPESDVGRNARFAMIKSLLDVNQVVRAKAVFEEMLADPSAYPPDHFVKVGELLLRKEQYLPAARSYRAFIAALGDEAGLSKEERTMKQRAMMGAARALARAEEHEEAAEVLRELVELYPTSGLFYEARFLLAVSLKQLELADEAIEVLRDIFQRAQDPGIISKATMELARLQLARGDKAAALASAQRIVLLGDPENSAVRPHYEAALAMSVVLQGEKAEWKNVTATGNRYLQLFPNGPSMTEVRRWLTRAGMQTALEGGTDGGAP